MALETADGAPSTATDVSRVREVPQALQAPGESIHKFVPAAESHLPTFSKPFSLWRH